MGDAKKATLTKKPSLGKRMTRWMAADGKTPGDRRREAEAKAAAAKAAAAAAAAAAAPAEAAAAAPAEEETNVDADSTVVEDSEDAVEVTDDADADDGALATRDPNLTLHDAWKGPSADVQDVVSPGDSVSEAAAEAVETTATQGRTKVVSQAVAAGALFVAGSVAWQYALDRRSGVVSTSTTEIDVETKSATEVALREPEQVCLARPVSESIGYKSACVRWAEGGMPTTEPAKRHLPRLVLEKLE